MIDEDYLRAREAVILAPGYAEYFDAMFQGDAEQYIEAAVLDHAAQVASLDTSGVGPTSHPLPLENVLRADEPRPCLDRDEVLAQAPAVAEGRFKVPRILGEGT